MTCEHPECTGDHTNWATMCPAAKERKPKAKTVAEKRAELEAAGRPWPDCECHGAPAYWNGTRSRAGGNWQCNVLRRETGNKAQNARRNKNKAAGLCAYCKEPAAEGRHACQRHLDDKSASLRRIEAERIEAGLCGTCGDPKPGREDKYECARCAQKSNERVLAARAEAKALGQCRIQGCTKPAGTGGREDLCTDHWMIGGQGRTRWRRAQADQQDQKAQTALDKKLKQLQEEASNGSQG